MHHRVRIAGAVALATVGSAAVLATTGSAHRASAARADVGTSYASIVRIAGGYEYVAGISTDNVLGQTALTYKLKAVPNSAGTLSLTVPQVTIFNGTGSLTGSATATLTIKGSKQTITNGKLTLNKGTGSLAGHSFVGTFTGSNEGVPGFIFHQKGTYK